MKLRKLRPHYVALDAALPTGESDRDLATTIHYETTGLRGRQHRPGATRLPSVLASRVETTRWTGGPGEGTNHLLFDFASRAAPRASGMKTEKNAMGNQDAELWQHESTSVATCREASVQREQSQESPRAIGRCGSRPITAYGRGGKFGGLKVLVACGDSDTGPAVRSPSGAKGDVCLSTHSRYATGEMLAPTGTQTTSR